MQFLIEARVWPEKQVSKRPGRNPSEEGIWPPQLPLHAAVVVDAVTTVSAVAEAPIIWMSSWLSSRRTPLSFLH
ncbi:hypothetical protein PR202_gb00320 [Eleusine coracana subsp. coracana]|uniref:Uncharacterized protein n=1 Tax=Eleusine coracana subsp. coracana TaxID=191504 RepID=A0AAV5DSA8_ELECO|nr:hypothetical protein PR202_gb00320 [Eleusine coracana subsp. coracana]